MSRQYERNLDAANQDEREETQVYLNAQSNAASVNAYNILNGVFEDSTGQGNYESLLNDYDKDPNCSECKWSWPFYDRLQLKVVEM